MVGAADVFIATYSTLTKVKDLGLTLVILSAAIWAFFLGGKLWERRYGRSYMFDFTFFNLRRLQALAVVTVIAFGVLVVGGLAS